MFEEKDIVLRAPLLDDGMAVYRLVERCPPLDTNSSYCNLLQCSHFSTTSVAALLDDSVVGFISAYVLPERADTLFVWQVAVDELARGQGLAIRMLSSILERPQCNQVAYIETTITEDNHASWSLFRRLAGRLEANFASSPWLDAHDHFKGEHPSEALVRIGPLTNEGKK